ncbi:MAG: Holliday junction branch migration protein RuvA [bacterium]
MFDFLRGKLEDKETDRIVVEAQGVGYKISIPLSTYEKLPPEGTEVKIYTWMSASMYGKGSALYGFLTPEEREVFLILRSISKIGAKGALEILSKISKSFPDFRKAVIAGDMQVLTGIFALTKKTTERLIMGLKDKIEILSFAGKERFIARNEQEIADAISGLVALGYRVSQAREAVNSVCETLGQDARAEEIIKQALKYL